MCGILPFFVRETRRLCIHAQYGGGEPLAGVRREESEEKALRRVQGNIQFRRHKASGKAAEHTFGRLGGKALSDDGIFH